ncbi:unnamed protein product [Amoebophrya sp. A25]|nr:unnamed protein product [Amoebophrya sp. A25]|eukprot:GSA25T00003979001.1
MTKYHQHRTKMTRDDNCMWRRLMLGLPTQLTLLAVAEGALRSTEFSSGSSASSVPAAAKHKPCLLKRPFPYDSSANAHLWKKNVKTVEAYELFETEELPRDFSWREVDWSHVVRTGEKLERVLKKKADEAPQPGQKGKTLMRRFLSAFSLSESSVEATEQQHLRKKYEHVQTMLLEKSSGENEEDKYFDPHWFDKFDRILPRVVGNVTHHIEHYLAPTPARTVSMLTPILNQHIPRYCGACWLHAGVSAMNDRLKIARRGRGEDVVLSRQVVLNCGKDTAGSCNGGSDVTLYNYVKQHGLPDESCQVYEARDYECSPFRTCMNCDPTPDGRAGNESSTGCYAVQRFGKYFVEEYGVIDLAAIKKELEAKMPNDLVASQQGGNGATPSSSPGGYDMVMSFMAHAEMIRRMKAEIYLRGPITCSVDSNIMLGYSRGHILYANEPKPAGWDFDHLIGVVGWGVQSAATPTLPVPGKNRVEGTPFWHVRNSWGTAWGEEGWLPVALGANVVGIETTCAWVALNPEPVVKEYGPPGVENGHLFLSQTAFDVSGNADAIQTSEINAQSGGDDDDIELLFQ